MPISTQHEAYHAALDQILKQVEDMSTKIGHSHQVRTKTVSLGPVDHGDSIMASASISIRLITVVKNP